MSRAVFPVLAACFFALVFLPLPARAGLFDDNEARAQITAIKQDYEQKISALSNAQLELATQIIGLKEEIARLRGEIETLHYENAQAQKRQQDLYLDLDSRLARFENPSGASGAPADDKDGILPAKPISAADFSAIGRAYDAAIQQFKEQKYKEAGAAFAILARDYPDSEIAASAQYWLGNSWYAQGKCKEAIDAQLTVARNWPDAPRAPDALLAAASCQQKLGNAAAARKTLSTVMEKYPASEAAKEAKKRLAGQ
ncbi:MAG: tol-pal system protein YbgF [Zoogloeaceae bacterium]|jgi:tol-pal system protein YbgF|nr:tol-pal system protein YbgF [Zoogloeaceae bacterium]